MISDTQYDALIIGGGPGGTPAAMALAQAGKRVLLVEAGRGLGGTCLFEGCIPSKIFRETAARRHELGRLGEFGLSMANVTATNINWSAVQAHKHEILRKRSQAALTKAKSLPGLELAFGHARLTGIRSAVIEANGERHEIGFENAILATGSVASQLSIPGADLPGVLDSKGLIEIGFVPESLVLIGGGPIGVEMAQIFAMLGTQVTILEAGSRILGPVDGILVNLLTDRLKEDGIDVQTDVVISTIDGEENQHTVRYSQNGHSHDVTGQIVAIVAGRHPNVDGLGLESTTVRHDRHGVKVDSKLQTDEPGIYATGDLIGTPMFAHWATAQALAVARHLIGVPATFPHPEHNSAVIFSYPELGMAGLTEEAARASGLDVTVAEYDYQVDARSQITGDAFGRLRIVYRQDNLRIVGIHALVEGAADLMGEAALAIRHGLTLNQMASAIHPHPTLTEAFGLTALNALSQQAFRSDTG